MIVRIKFLDREEKPFTILFGDSYKSWKEQLQEYLNYKIKWWDTDILKNCDISAIEEVDYSLSDWISFGGLKWCNENIFQQELNREGCKETEPDNPNPRKYEYFKYYKGFEKKVKMMYNLRLRHLKRKSYKTILKHENKKLLKQ